MKTVHVALIAVFTLFAGSVGGYLLGVQSAPSPGPRVEQAALAPADPAPDKVVAQSPETKSVVHTPSQPADAPTPDDRETEPVKPPSDALQAWLRTLADEVPQPGNGRIWGRITTAEGTPVVGATITASPRWTEQQWPSTPDPSIEEVLESYGRNVHFSRAGRVKATTDENGGYEITGLGEYSFSVTATADGYQCNSRGSTYNVKPDAEVNFTAKPMCEVELDIRLPDGTQPKTATATFAQEGNTRGMGWSLAKPKVQSEPGKWSLTVTAGEKKEYGCDPIELDLKLDEPPAPVTVQLRAVPGILCKVKVPATWEERGMLQAYVMPDPPAEPPTMDAWRRGTMGGDIRSESLWNNNEATFANLKPGRWRVMAGTYNKLMAWQDVTLADEMLTVTLEVAEPELKDYIVARVYSPTGELVRNSRISARLMGKGPDGRNRSSGGMGGSALKREDGSYWITRMQPEAQLKDYVWTYNITATTPEYGSVTATYPFDGTHELEIRHVAPVMLTIVIPGATTHPYKDRIRPQLMVSTGENSWSGVQPSRGPRRLQTDSLKYGPISPGKYRFSLRIERDNEYGSGGYGSNDVATWNFELASGEATQTCAIPTLCKLTIQIPDPTKVNSLRIHTIGADNYAGRHIMKEAITERVEFDALPAGEWMIVTSDGEMKIRLNGDVVVTLATTPYDCLRIGKLREAGRLEELGFRDGDLVIRVDGQEAETVALLRAQTQGAMAKESTTWTLLRGGAQVDLTFNGKTLMEITSALSENREHLPLSNASR